MIEENNKKNEIIFKTLGEIDRNIFNLNSWVKNFNKKVNRG